MDYKVIWEQLLLQKKRKLQENKLRAQDGLRVLRDPGTSKVNLEETLRGMAIVTGMRFIDGDSSGGEILDPDTGGVYRSSMRLSEDGRRLTVRGYIGIPLFGRSQEWVRAD